ncbi:capsule assembly Wzi family protein [Segetibacter aerophilus]|nr:capsule assembly Wzi family protein [Segetibacter aerophilus]
MQIIKSVRILVFFLSPLIASSQSSYIPLGTKDYQMLDRLEIKTGNVNLMHSTVKPFNRRLTTHEVENIDSLVAAGDPSTKSLTEIDQYNMQRFLMNNSEWSKPRESYNSKKPFLKSFYKTKGNFFEINTPDFFLAFNPVIQYQQMVEKGNSQNLFYNSRGASIRGMISKKVAFDLYITDNQERDPLYVQDWIRRNTAVPGARYYKNFKAAGGYDYFDNRGSVSINATKYIDIQLGYDKNFIGDGHRSLLLSDFSGNALFLKFNTRIWKFNYENLFMELIPNYRRASGDYVLPRKYFRMNYLTFNATKWLNVGVFDAVVFGRQDHFDFQYIVPVMFLRPAESDIGSGDKAKLGLTAKANIKKKLQVYGQFVLDEFVLKQVVKNNGFWANKYGYQLGVKYPDAFGVKNLDLQVESNRVRPFTYTHNDSIGNYTHYNQPLAHPLGANFQEYIGILKYQPLNKLYLQAKAIYYYQGLDSAGINFGSNINAGYNTRTRDFGYFVGDGNKVKSMNINLLASYELKENLFVDANLQRRTYNRAVGGNTSATIFSFGVRWNMARRNFDF